MQTSTTLQGLNRPAVTMPALPVLDDDTQTILSRLGEGARKARELADTFKAGQKRVAQEALQRARETLKALEKSALQLAMLGADPGMFLDMVNGTLRSLEPSLRKLREGATAQQQFDINTKTRDLAAAAERIGILSRSSWNEDYRTEKSRKRLASTIYEMRRVDFRI